MRVLELQHTLAQVLARVRIEVPEGTALHRTATAELDMVQAYASDSRTFLAGDDPVNALAACAYGFGWLHFGMTFGLLECPGPGACPFTSPYECLPGACREKLSEKTARYQRLLTTALSSVSCAPDPSTPAYRFAQKVLFIAGLYAGHGSRLLRGGNREEALACFSYGHGWLDAGVTAGLFIIHAERDIFTV